METGGGGSGKSITLETNGTPNGSQTLLNLVAGTYITLTDDGLGDVTIAFSEASGVVTSVSNSDGTLTISPTTGAVVASLALGHANTWTAKQTFSTSNISITGGTSGYVLSTDGSGVLSWIAAGGGGGSPPFTIASGDNLALNGSAAPAFGIDSSGSPIIYNPQSGGPAFGFDTGLYNPAIYNRNTNLVVGVDTNYNPYLQQDNGTIFLQSDNAGGAQVTNYLVVPTTESATIRSTANANNGISIDGTYITFYASDATAIFQVSGISGLVMTSGHPLDLNQSNIISSGGTFVTFNQPVTFNGNSVEGVGTLSNNNAGYPILLYDPINMQSGTSIQAQGTTVIDANGVFYGSGAAGFTGTVSPVTSITVFNGIVTAVS